jgi:hypothetical protein
VHHDYREDLVKLGIINRLYCSESERAEFLKNSLDLPEDVFTARIDGKIEFWRYPDIDDEQMLRILKIKNALNLRAIKYCAIVFTIIVAIFVLLSLRI